ncbi:MAG: hypothetical protein ACE5PT_04020 [Gemmatimonadales bacterium]
MNRTSKLGALAIAQLTVLGSCSPGDLGAQQRIGAFIIEEDTTHGCMASTPAVHGDYEGRLSLFLALDVSELDVSRTLWVEGGALAEIAALGEFDRAGQFYGIYVADHEPSRAFLWQYDSTAENRHGRAGIAYPYGITQAALEARQLLALSFENHQEGMEGLIGNFVFDVRQLADVWRALEECSPEPDDGR